jgi:hypothetical protein
LPLPGATGKGSFHFTGGTEEFAGASGEGSFEEAGTVISLEPYVATDSGTETWKLHLPWEGGPERPTPSETGSSVTGQPNTGPPR